MERLTLALVLFRVKDAPLGAPPQAVLRILDAEKDQRKLPTVPSMARYA